MLYNFDYKDWRQASPIMNNWPDVLIMGSSIAKESIDPKELEKEVSDNEKLNVGNIALNAGSMSSSYLTLKRITATCEKCPKVIVYQVTDVGLKKNEIPTWRDPAMRRIINLYYPDAEIDQVLEKAAKIDPYYNSNLRDIKIYSLLKTPFSKGRLINMILGQYFSPAGFYFTNNFQQIVRNGKVVLDNEGFYPEPRKMTNDTLKFQLDFEKKTLKDFSTGGAPDLFFKEFLDVAKENNIKVILVLTPEYEIHQKTFPKEEKILMDYLSKISKEKNITLIDNRKYKSTDKSIFYDPRHLNSEGAKIYSRYLGNEISKLIEMN